jgi:hypothetical protein
VDAALAFVEEWEAADRQLAECHFLDLGEQLAHLPARRAVDARVCHGRFPIKQKAVLLVETGKDTALECVLLDVVDAALDLPLMARHVRPRRQKHRAIMLGERLHLGVQFRFEPVDVFYGRAQVVEHDTLRHTTEVPERILQAADEVLRRLPIDHLAVRLPRVTQHDAKHIGPSPLAIRPHDPGACAEIDLRLLTWSALQSTKRQRRRLAESFDEAADAVIPRRETVLAHQVLPNALTAQTLIQLRQNEGAEWFAGTGRKGQRRERGSSR